MKHPAIELLYRLVGTPSVSRTEDATADIIDAWLRERGIQTNRIHNNVWAVSQHYDPSLPTILLNSHHDTVKPSPSYTFDPYRPFYADGRLYGLGSNDAGASLVSLLTVFADMYHDVLPFNLLMAASAEEEVMGEHGMRALLPELQAKGVKIDMAIVGEPTGMQPAIAERGLVVLDCTAHGKTGHAARNEGVNALYKAVDDIQRLRTMEFPRVSPTLGPIKVTVTQIEAGRQHNVVPEECRFVVDVRTTDAYTNEQTVELIRQAVECDVAPRSYRVRASVIAEDHPLVAAAAGLGKVPFVSPTTSDMALMPGFPSLKIGPGDSARSHSADEYICESEIMGALHDYRAMLDAMKSMKLKI